MPEFNKEQIEKLIDEQIKKVVPVYLRTAAFTIRKVADTPIDNFSTVSRRYVNMFGSTLSGGGSTVGRPINSIIGQQFFDTDIGYPIFKNQNNRWVSATGS